MSTGWKLYNLAKKKDIICQNMYDNGWNWSFENAARLRSEYEAKVEQASAPLIKLAEKLGVPGINLASPKQLRDLYFNKFKVPAVLWTETGEPSLNEDALTVYVASDNPVASEFSKRLLDVRGYEKLLGTYIIGCAPAPGKRRVHGKWKQGPVTGRLACTGVPLQTFPGSMRPLLCAEEGTELVECDKSQIEIRLIGVQADIRLFRETYDRGGDVYLDVARAMFQKPHLDKRTEEGKKLRQLSKSVTLGSNYMGQEDTLHRLMYANPEVRAIYPDLSVRQVAALRRAYLSSVPELPKWWQMLIDLASKTGEYVEKVSGRIVAFVGPPDGPFYASYRNQALAAFLVDNEWINIYDDLEAGEEMKGQCHDAVVAQSPNGLALEQKMVGHMTTDITFEGRSMHLPCEAKRGFSWADCK